MGWEGVTRIHGDVHEPGDPEALDGDGRMVCYLYIDEDYSETAELILNPLMTIFRIFVFSSLPQLF